MSTEPKDQQAVALVTGANRGLGLETCRQLAARGCRVWLTTRDRGRAEAAAAELSDQPGAVVPAGLEVTDPDAVAAIAERLRDEAGRLDILVNNAGVPPDGGGVTVFDVDWETIDTAMATHVYAPLRLTRALLPLLRGSGRGRIVNVASTLGQLENMGRRWPGYRLSKAALNALTTIMAAELEGTGVLVNSVCPGWVRTDLGGPSAPRSVEEGADTIVYLATLPDDGPSGGFFQDRQRIPW